MKRIIFLTFVVFVWLVSAPWLHAQGEIVSFDAPGAGTGGTNPFSISPSGEAMGSYLDSNFVFHGFVREP